MQLRELNKQLVDKLHKFEDHEATILDRHLEFERIREGFDKICQGFSDINDASLGNLSVRGATKKMLLNLQQFTYEQIAMMKVNYSHRMEDIKESFSEEIEMLNEALAEACLKATTFKIQAETIVEERETKQDTSQHLIDDLTAKLEFETERANDMTFKFNTADAELTQLRKQHDDLSLRFEKLTEKCDREIDLKQDLKERLEEIENKYQNVSISTMHSKISSLKCQLDLQRLEDAKKLYDKDKKLKKAMEALKTLKAATKQLAQRKEGDEGEGEDFDDDPMSPAKLLGRVEDDLEKYAVDSDDDEDPEEIERNIKKMLQEEEEKRKAEEEAAQEIPPPELNDTDAYKVDREGFEKAILSNPNIENMY